MSIGDQRANEDCRFNDLFFFINIFGLLRSYLLGEQVFHWGIPNLRELSRLLSNVFIFDLLIWSPSPEITTSACCYYLLSAVVLDIMIAIAATNIHHLLLQNLYQIPREATTTFDVNAPKSWQVKGIAIPTNFTVHEPSIHSSFQAQTHTVRNLRTCNWLDLTGLDNSPFPEWPTKPIDMSLTLHPLTLMMRMHWPPPRNGFVLNTCCGLDWMDDSRETVMVVIEYLPVSLEWTGEIGRHRESVLLSLSFIPRIALSDRTQCPTINYRIMITLLRRSD